MIAGVTFAIVIGIYVVSAAWYLVACWRQPYNLCESCMDIPYLRERCDACGKTGVQRRWGARLLRRE